MTPQTQPCCFRYRRFGIPGGSESGQTLSGSLAKLLQLPPPRGSAASNRSWAGLLACLHPSSARLPVHVAQWRQSGVVRLTAAGTAPEWPTWVGGTGLPVSPRSADALQGTQFHAIAKLSDHKSSRRPMAEATLGPFPGRGIDVGASQLRHLPHRQPCAATFDCLCHLPFVNARHRADDRTITYCINDYRMSSSSKHSVQSKFAFLYFSLFMSIECRRFGAKSRLWMNHYCPVKNPIS